MRISELAREIGVKSVEIIAELKKLKVTGKTASSRMDEANIPAIKQKFAAEKTSGKKIAAKKTVKKSTVKAKKTEKTAKPAEKKSKPVTAIKPIKAVQTKPATVPREVEQKKAEEAEKAAEEERKKEEHAKRLAEAQAKIKAEEARKKEEEELRRIEKEIEEEEKLKKEEDAKKITISKAVTPKELAVILKTSTGEVIKKLFLKGTAVTVNQTLSAELAAEVAMESGYIATVETPKAKIKTAEKQKPSEDLSHLPIRPPVVTVMGHVDHGKTSLLDKIRKTDVAGREAGGITQHIGAYSIDVGNGPVTFIDTPGHEAFTALRARGAQVTDLVVLVVAADDGVMPQTEEAINHAKAAGVTILVAVNKIDTPGAQPDKVKQDLTRFELVPEEWGGDVIFCNVSAKTGEGIDHLMEMIHLQAELLELRADSAGNAIATVIESRLDKSRGPVHTIIVSKGKLRKGDSFVAGSGFGKVRAMMDDRGAHIKEAGPAMPVELLGADALCPPGEELAVVENDRKARQISQERQSDWRLKRFTQKEHVRLDNVIEKLKGKELKELRLVIKGDTQGSVDGVAELLSRLAFEQVKLRVIHRGVGGVTETDIMLADASDAIVVGFNVRPTEKAKKLAEQEQIDIRMYSIIYEITNDIKAAVLGMLEPEIVEKQLGRAEVRETFKVSKVGTIAGCKVLEGLIRRNCDCRLLRDNVVVHTGTVSSLRRFKEDVKEVVGGYECGIGIEKYNDLKIGDVIEIFEQKEVTAQLVNA